MATVVKTAGFAALLRFLFYAFGSELSMWHYTMWVVATLTILVGNFSAVYQSSVKRMLAYSSVANAGYLLLGILSMNNETPAVIFYYTFAYSLATISAFAVLMVVSAERGSDDYEAFNGLARRSPLLAGLMVIAMLSLAGIPPLAGFFAKYFVFSSALSSNMNATDNSYLWLVLIAVVNSLIGVYYYFRVIVAIFTPDADAEQTINVKLSYRIVLGCAAVLLLITGLFPNQLINPMVESNVSNVSSAPANSQMQPAGNSNATVNIVTAKPALKNIGQKAL
jgi:NADH-quinone oxidoreductase subunit N